ncbi:MAG: hypothetical protein ACUVT2_08210 [Thiobacillaceae bacterium]
MTRHSLTALLSILAISATLSTTPAQACMFGLPFLPNNSSCAAGAAGNPSCPTQAQPGGRDGDCLLHKRDLMDAANTMGSMAAGGMEMAGGIMRSLADKAMRLVPPEQGI